MVAILALRRRRRLPVPVPAMVRAPEDVAARDRRRSSSRPKAIPMIKGKIRQIPPGPHAQAHDGGGAEGLGRHHQPDPLRGRAAIRARHERAGLRRQGRRRDRAARSARSPASTTFRSSRTRRSRARCTPPSRSTRKSRPSTTRRWPRSSATSCGCSRAVGGGRRMPPWIAAEPLARVP